MWMKVLDTSHNKFICMMDGSDKQKKFYVFYPEVL